MTAPSQVDADQVIQFWFGELDEQGMPDKDHQQRWWQSTPEFDREIEARFGRLMEQALTDDLPGWSNDSRTLLAQVILLDQFYRNVFRKTGRAFAADQKAESITQKYLHQGDFDMPLVYQYFLLMPLMHAENLSSQQRALVEFQRLLDRANDAQRELFAGALKFARLHHDIVARFGRFPHRNEALGRASTEQELEWLADDAPRFGQ